MQKIFLDSRILDRKARENFFLSEELMMENAAAGLEAAVLPKIFHESGRYIERPCVLILAGRGNNGADGIALSRRLVCKKICVAVCCLGEPATEIARLQKKRAESLGVYFLSVHELDSFAEEKSFDISVVVDCIYGSGFHLPLDPESESAILFANQLDAFKVSCDVPSGLDSFGLGSVVFRADETIVSGALKLNLFSDMAQDFCGKISVCNLGLERSSFEATSFPDAFMLEKSDMRLPFRKKRNVHKGNFGHVAVVCGKKKGAAQISGNAAFAFGAGLVSLSDCEDSGFMHLMASSSIPENVNTVVLGPGLGRKNEKATVFFDFLLRHEEVSCVLDADAFYYEGISTFLENRRKSWLETYATSSVCQNKAIVLTPHPKEFSSLLSLLGFGDFSVSEVIEKKISLTKTFCEKYRNTILLLKGAVVTIGFWSEEENRVILYFNPHGTSALAKGGSGDVLSGLVASLLAQGYDSLDAVITASLAHSFASFEIQNNFALTPQALIECVMSIQQ